MISGSETKAKEQRPSTIKALLSDSSQIKTKNETLAVTDLKSTSTPRTAINRDTHGSIPEFNSCFQFHLIFLHIIRDGFEAHRPLSDKSEPWLRRHDLRRSAAIFESESTQRITLSIHSFRVRRSKFQSTFQKRDDVDAFFGRFPFETSDSIGCCHNSFQPIRNVLEEFSGQSFL
mmetsp:Transcript_20553/g.48388  ORF Transcript_20553/g.48388 Transcript_20553/m.48388 type:complete len:175 (+) Transcript_20553:126-650(+)